MTGKVTSLAFCWRLERRDGAGVGLTSHDAAVIAGEEVYSPAPGMTPAAIQIRAGLDPQSGEIAGALSAAVLTDEDLSTGRWDSARAMLFATDWDGTAAAPIELVGGGIGPVSTSEGQFVAELVGTAAQLSEPACPETSPECRAELGDRRCRVNLAGRRMFVEAQSVEGSRLTFGQAIDDGFLFGEAAILSGGGCGWRTQVVRVESNAVVLRDLPPFDLDPGVRVRLIEGCDKRFATCRTRFANAINFRGEPHLPGNDLLTRFPGA